MRGKGWFYRALFKRFTPIQRVQFAKILLFLLATVYCMAAIFLSVSC